MQNNIEVMISEIIGKLHGLYITSYIYHWGCNNNNFYGDHLLFERIADDLEDYIDALNEKALLVISPKSIMNLVHPILTQPNIENYGEATNSNDAMFLNLQTLIINIINSISECDTKIRGIDALLDNISEDLHGKLGLINQRLRKF